MEYVVWAVVALFAYSAVAPLTSIATEEIPPAAGLFLATIVFLVITAGVLVVTGVGDPGYAVTSEAGYVYVAGVFLAIGILAYVGALEVGPVSVVVPIFGMFIVGSSALGIVFLGEAITIQRLAGIGCAVVAIVLGAGGD